MLVFVKERLVLIDVPKCATTSVNSVLRPQTNIIIGGSPNLKHLKFREAFCMLDLLLSGKFDIREFEFVSLFRNPVEWMYSWYCYRSRNELKNPLHPNHLNRVVEGMSFESFCSTYLQGGERLKCHPSSYQFDFVSDNDELLGVDKCFSFHSLDFFESWLSERLDRKLVFPKKNSSSTLGNSNLSDDVLGRFCLKYPNDFRLFEKLAVEPVVLKADFNSEKNVSSTSSRIR